jgi:hypothetical protein
MMMTHRWGDWLALYRAAGMNARLSNDAAQVVIRAALADRDADDQAQDPRPHDRQDPEPAGMDERTKARVAAAAFDLVNGPGKSRPGTVQQLATALASQWKPYRWSNAQWLGFVQRVVKEYNLGQQTGIGETPWLTGEHPQALSLADRGVPQPFDLVRHRQVVGELTTLGQVPAPPVGTRSGVQLALETDGLPPGSLTSAERSEVRDLIGDLVAGTRSLPRDRKGAAFSTIQQLSGFLGRNVRPPESLVTGGHALLQAAAALQTARGLTRLKAGG